MLILESNARFQEACHKEKEVLKQMEGLPFKVIHLLVHHGRPPWPSAMAIRHDSPPWPFAVAVRHGRLPWPSAQLKL
jgi:hypothetical protein